MSAAREEVTIMRIVERRLNWEGTCRECGAKQYASQMKGSELTHDCTTCGDQWGVEWRGK